IVLLSCISRLQNVGCTSLQELTELRAQRSLILQHGLCRGIDRLDANTRLGLARERHRRSLPRLHGGRGRECNASRPPVWEGLGAALSIEMMMFDRSINVRVRWTAGGLRYSDVRLLLRCWRESRRAPSASMIKWRRRWEASRTITMQAISSLMSYACSRPAYSRPLGPARSAQAP